MTSTLKIQYADNEPIDISGELIRSSLSSAIIDDVSQLESKRHGVGIRIADLLQLVPETNTPQHLTMRSSDGFTAELPIDIANGGILIFELNGQPLPDSAGGPFRFFTIASAACGTAVADNCANVKGVVCIQLS